MSQTASCICGAVRLHLKQRPKEAGICHCGMCRKFSGGVYIGILVPSGGLEVENEEALTRYASSPWAERGFCSKCGSSLFYRVTAPGPHHDEYHISLGCIDQPDGIPVTEEIFSDKRPDGYAFAGDLPGKTEAEMMALFGAGDD